MRNSNHMLLRRCTCPCPSLFRYLRAQYRCSYLIPPCKPYFPGYPYVRASSWSLAASPPNASLNFPLLAECRFCSLHISGGPCRAFPALCQSTNTLRFRNTSILWKSHNKGRTKVFGLANWQLLRCLELKRYAKHSSSLHPPLTFCPTPSRTRESLVPVFDLWRWKRHQRCRGKNSDLWGICLHT